jgi:hypothetical protein
MAEPHVGVTSPVRRASLAQRVRLPRLSGKASAVWLVVCFVLTAALIPMALRLPHWVEFEIVLAVWWAIWLAVLSRFLYTGQRVTDDHEMHEPRFWFASEPSKPYERDPDRSWWNGYFWGSTWGDGDAFLIVVGLFLLLGLIWFLFEIAIPVLLFLLYFVARGMLARVVNDHHHCREKVKRALGWGMVWATVYTAPLAAAVWFIHHVYQRAQPGV